MNYENNEVLTEKQISDLEFSDQILSYVVLSLISTAISVYAIGLKRINIATPVGETPPIDRLYIRKLAVTTGIISLIISCFYYCNSKKFLEEAKIKTKALRLEYLANAINFIPTLIRLYILLCMTTTNTLTNEDVIAGEAGLELEAEG